MKDLLIIGGSNIDYTASSVNPLIPEDSNIGHLNISFGGVARNVVENLARLGDKITFITAIGNDAGGQKLRRDLRSLKVKVFAIEDKNCPTSSYLSINDNLGNMTVGVCDSRILDCRTTKDIAFFNDITSKHHNIVLDANLNQETIDYIFANYFSHLFYVEAVSASKVSRFRKHLKEIYLFKMNYLEAKTLMNEDKDIHTLANDILSAGVKNVVISNGSNPIVYGNASRIEDLPVEKATHIVSECGAGDALFAGVLHEMIEKGKNLGASVKFGAMLSKATLQVSTTVNPDIKRLVSSD